MAKNQLGTTRNITDKFSKLRENAKSYSEYEDSRGDLGKLIDSAIDSSKPVELTEVKPVWMQQTDDIKADLKNLKSQVSELRSLHNQGGLVSFSTEDDSQERIVDKSEQIKIQIKRTDAKIQALSKFKQEGGSDAQIVSQVQKELAGGLLQLSNDYRKQGMKYVAKKARDAGISRDSLGFLDDQQQGPSNFESDMGLSENQLNMLDNATGVIQQRDQEVAQAVESIAELVQIMRDLSVLVQEQGTIVDRIDYNIEQVAMSVEKGVEQLQKAEKSQKASRMTMCILCLVAAVIIFLLIAVFLKLV
eukprot:TRINITY_DN7233_c0_g3_i1.p1 TRINITY_DN7233_c0_g3~~TRINITY_DN7233_c0_g3_i1.p1  ORF type:complete len:304 (+),score=69.63 TRINITY_DN7233_c0_g3_i1:21-932(+)